VDESLDELRRSLTGAVLAPTDAGYDAPFNITARAGWQDAALDLQYIEWPPETAAAEHPPP
jgi:hypothetical protein